MRGAILVCWQVSAEGKMFAKKLRGLGFAPARI